MAKKYIILTIYILILSLGTYSHANDEIPLIRKQCFSVFAETNNRIAAAKTISPNIDLDSLPKGVNFCSTCHSMQKATKNFLESSHGKKKKGKHRATCTQCHIYPGFAGFAEAKLNGLHQMKKTYDEKEGEYNGIIDTKYIKKIAMLAASILKDSALEHFDYKLSGNFHGKKGVEYPKMERAKFIQHVRKTMIERDSATCMTCHSYKDKNFMKKGASSVKKHAFALGIRSIIEKDQKEHDEMEKQVIEQAFNANSAKYNPEYLNSDEYNDNYSDLHYLKEKIKKNKEKSTCMACHTNLHQADMHDYDEYENNVDDSDSHDD